MSVSKPSITEVKAVRKAAIAGDPVATCKMGDWHLDNVTLRHNPKRALRYFKAAAASGLAEAQCKAAGLVWQLAQPGDGIRPYEEIAHFCKMAAAQGDAVGKTMLVAVWESLKSVASGERLADFKAGALDIRPIEAKALADNILSFMREHKLQPAMEAVPTPNV